MCVLARVSGGILSGVSSAGPGCEIPVLLKYHVCNGDAAFPGVWRIRLVCVVHFSLSV